MALRMATLITLAATTARAQKLGCDMVLPVLKEWASDRQLFRICNDKFPNGDCEGAKNALGTPAANASAQQVANACDIVSSPEQWDANVAKGLEERLRRQTGVLAEEKGELIQQLDNCFMRKWPLSHRRRRASPGSPDTEPEESQPDSVEPPAPQQPVPIPVHPPAEPPAPLQPTPAPVQPPSAEWIYVLQAGKSARHTACPPGKDRRCAGSFDDCLKIAQNLCNRRARCQALHISRNKCPLTGQYIYGTLTCTETSEDDQFAHYTKVATSPR